MNEIDIHIKTEYSKNVVVYGCINGKIVSYRGIFTHGDKKSFFNAVRKAVDYAIRSSRVHEPGDVVILPSDCLLTAEQAGCAIRWAASRSDNEISRPCLAQLNVFAKTYSNEHYEVIFADEEFTAISQNINEGSIVRIVPTDCLK